MVQKTHNVEAKIIPYVKFNNTFEGGSNGSTVTTGNSGGLSQDAFHSVTIAGTGTLTYDNTNAVDTLSAKIVNSTGQNSFVEWRSLPVLTTYGRFSLYFTAAPTGNPNLFQARNGSGTISASIRLTTGRKLTLVDNGGTSRATTIGTLNTSQWYWVEFKIIHDSVNGFMELTFYDDPRSAIPNETITAEGINTGTQADRWYFGISNFPAAAHTYWMDSIEVNATEWTGPYEARYHYVDAYKASRKTKTHNIDNLLKATLTKTYDIDASITKRQKTYEITGLLKKTLSKTHSIDASLQNLTTRRFSQVFAEVIESPTTVDRRFSQIVLEVAYDGKTTKTYQLDVLVGQLPTYSIELVVMKIGSKTHSVDSYIDRRLGVPKQHSIDFIIGRYNLSHSIDALFSKPAFSLQHVLEGLIQKRFTTTYTLEVRKGPAPKTTAIDILRKATLTQLYSLEANISKVSVGVTHGIDAIRLPAGGRKTKTHSIDSVRKKAVQKTYNVQAVMFALTKIRKTYTMEALLSSEQGALENAIFDSIQYPIARLTHIIDLNNYYGKTISISDSPHPTSNKESSLVDGYDRASMRYGFADSGSKVNAQYRLFPDIDFSEGDEYIDFPKVPWVSSTLCDINGNFGNGIEFTVSYSGIEINNIQVVSDRFGRGRSGIITNMKIEVSIDDGDTWTTIASNLSGEGNIYPYKVNIWYNGSSWQQTKPVGFTEMAYVTNIRYTIYSITVDQSVDDEFKPRRLVMYEFSPRIWYENQVAGSDAVSAITISEQRDLSGQTLSPIAASTSNTVSVDTINFDRNLYDLLFRDTQVTTPSLYNSHLIVEFGYNLLDGSYVYTNYGSFIVDDATLSSDFKVSFTGRDFSKYLQDSKMLPSVYEGYLLHEVIQDVIERAGIENYRIDSSVLLREELATGIIKEFLSTDEVDDVINDNVVWTNDQTYWEFLQQISNADLGAFYFDRDGTFIYKSKEEFTTVIENKKTVVDEPVEEYIDPIDGETYYLTNTGAIAGTTVYEYDWLLTEDTEIANFNSRKQLEKNTFSLRYRVPKMSDGDISLWEPSEPVTLSSTALGAPIDSASKTILVGDISDWPRSGYIQIDDEIIKYNSRGREEFRECERGFLGSQPKPHYPKTSESNWTFTGGDWQMSGGSLWARDQGNAWGYALTTNVISARNFHARGIATINRNPFKAAVVIRAAGINNMFKFVIKSFASGESGSVGTDSTEVPYELWQIQAGEESLLKESKKTVRNVFTGIPFVWEIQAQDKELSLFIKGTKVLHYNIDDSNLDLDGNQKVGFGARGNGPTEFEGIQIMSLPEDNEGETQIFSDEFGRPVYEIKKIEADYSTAPATNITYYMTNTSDAEVFYFKPQPFSATMYLRNKRSGITLVHGQLPGDNQNLSEYLYIVGEAVEQEEDKEATLNNQRSVVKYGKQELQAQLPWVQSETHAKILLDYLDDVYSDSVDFIEVSMARPNIAIKIGDIVKLSGSQYNLFFSQDDLANKNLFYVTNINTTFNSNGISQSLQLRSAATAALNTVVAGTYSCPITIPPKSFYVATDSNYSTAFGYPGYTEQAFNKGDSGLPADSLGFTVPVVVWRPSTLAGAIDSNNIMLPSAQSTSATGAFPTILWAHEAYSFDEDEQANNYHIKRWLSKIVRSGYNVIFMSYRGTGGITTKHFEKMSYGNKEVDDMKAVRDWAAARSYVNSSKIILAGLGHGANITLAATYLYRTSFAGYMALSGTPNIACSITRNRDGWPSYVVERYEKALGDIYDPDSLWLTKSAASHEALVSSNKILLVNGEIDSMAGVKEVYDFYTKCKALNKNITAHVYEGRSQAWLLSEDGGNPNKVFKSDPWRRIMSWLDSI